MPFAAFRRLLSHTLPITADGGKRRLPHRAAVTAFALMVIGPLSGCGGERLSPSAGPAGEPGSELYFSQFNDVPVPTEAKMDIGKTVILGRKPNWIGRLVFATSHSSLETFDFYLNEMPKFGWREIAQVRAETSVLTYELDGRVATVKIEGGTFGGADVDMTVAPREAGAGGGN